MPNPFACLRCSTLLKAAEDYGWSRQGDGNWSYYLELYAFYKDRKFHNTDVYKARGKATLVPLFVGPSSLPELLSDCDAPENIQAVLLLSCMHLCVAVCSLAASWHAKKLEAKSLQVFAACRLSRTWKRRRGASPPRPASSSAAGSWQNLATLGTWTKRCAPFSCSDPAAERAWTAALHRVVCALSPGSSMHVAEADSSEPRNELSHCIGGVNVPLWLQIRLLREVLEWGEGVEEGMAAAQAQPPQPTVTSVVAEALREPVPAEREAEGNIIVLLFPEGEFKEVPKGTTAANIIQEKVGFKTTSC